MQSTVSTPSSYTSVGSIHLHIDGGQQIGVIKSIVNELARDGHNTKLQTIIDIAAGPQRQKYPATYSSHTPGSDSKETFEFFSTIGLTNRIDAIATLKRVLPSLKNYPGIVIETESVVANVDVHGCWHSIPFAKVSPIASEEIGMIASRTMPFEIHHCIDIYDTPTNAVNVADLMQLSNALGLCLGGWFHFVKSGRLSYRSNAFAYADNLQDKVTREYQLLQSYLSKISLDYELRTIVEQVLGVWRIS